MKDRREFLKSAITLGAGAHLANRSAETRAVTCHSNERAYWLAVLEKIATPVLENLAQRNLKKTMPVEAANPSERARYTYLEAWGRLLAGIAPWLAAQGLEAPEARRQQKFIAWAQASLDAATDPSSADFMDFHDGEQPLVDTAFMAQGILRAPRVLCQGLDARVRAQIIEALLSSRAIPTPSKNNWVLFPAMIEAALHTMGLKTMEDRWESCVRRMLGWYLGDGTYGDGPLFHFDYYNSFVIHPMLLDVLAVLKQKDNKFEPVFGTALERARRYAEILERLIAPDGTFPCVGRSATYRFGAFHALAQMALMRQLPLNPAQVRSAMTAVICKMMEAPGTFDQAGWLQIGFYGHQPSLAEGYISTGSLYLCATALLPLGLPPSDVFWKAQATTWTSQRIWSGEPIRRDQAMADAR